MATSVQTLEGDSVTFSDDRLQELETTFRGPVIEPHDENYDEVRVVQNGMIDRRPGLVVRCSGAADVIDAVKLAGERNLLTAVRGGGHSVAGHSICDDGLMIDLSGMRGVWVDPDERVVRVQGGATWGDVDREAQAFGLAVPGGVVSTTGVAGLTLGGGIGWLHRKWGLTCDSLRAVELVTADGELVRASEEENPDLFWGLRGGGGNFGVVTSFEFDAYPLGPIVMCGAVMYAMEDADTVFPAWREWADTIPDEITSRALFWYMPEDPLLPSEVHDRHVLILGALYAGPADEGEEAIRPIRELSAPLADISDRMPYRMYQAAFDPLFPKGEMASYWKSIYLEELSDTTMDTIVERSRTRPSPLSIVHVPTMGGAAARVGATETAFGDRGAPYMLSVDGNWTDLDESDDQIAWVRDVVDEVGRLSPATGTYLNFSGDEEADAALMDAAYGDNVERLAQLKREYDPDNLFRLNNNIRPAD